MNTKVLVTTAVALIASMGSEASAGGLFQRLCGRRADRCCYTKQVCTTSHTCVSSSCEACAAAPCSEEPTVARSVQVTSRQNDDGSLTLTLPTGQNIEIRMANDILAKISEAVGEKDDGEQSLLEKVGGLNEGVLSVKEAVGEKDADKAPIIDAVNKP